MPWDATREPLPVLEKPVGSQRIPLLTGWTAEPCSHRNSTCKGRTKVTCHRAVSRPLITMYHEDGWIGFHSRATGNVLCGVVLKAHFLVYVRCFISSFRLVVRNQ
jgi:hypothetical protein